jgi:hypothetical protein
LTIWFKRGALTCETVAEPFHVIVRRTVRFGGRTVQHDGEMPRGHAARSVCPLDRIFLARVLSLPCG